MSLVQAEEGFRTVWMFPRNIRYIEPWKLHTILAAISALKSSDLKDRSTQDILYASLAEQGVKSEAHVRDKNDGGMRTYYAQLRCLGFAYGSDGKLTFAGKELLKGNEALNILRTQLLRLQYPSAYGNSPNVKIHPSLRVKPFVFILSLLKHPQIAHLTNVELMIPVIYGHNMDCFDLCVEKILLLRSKKIKQEADLVSIVQPEDIYLPRGGWKWGENPSQEKIKKQLGNIRNIANTAANYLRAAQLIQQTAEDAKLSVYEFNPDCQKLFEEEKHSKFIQDTAEETFQRAFGRYSKEKDTVKESPSRASGVMTFIQALYLNHKKDFLFEDMTNDNFIEKQAATWGLPIEKIQDALSAVIPKIASLERDTYLDYANSGGDRAIEFEKATAALLKKLGFDESLHIGQKKGPASRRGGYPDICIKRSGDSACGLADTKSTSSFIISSSDELKLTEHYLNSNQDFFPQSQLSYYLYIAGNFKKTMRSHIERISADIHIPVTAIRAKALYSMYEKKESLSCDDILRQFTSGTVIEN